DDDAKAIASLGTPPSDSSPGNPVNGSNTVKLAPPLARALGFSTSGGTDSTITLYTKKCNLDRNPKNIDGLKYDLQAATEHELDEALGLGSALDGLKANDPSPDFITPLDLYRYSVRERSFATFPAFPSYFSIDGGKTALVYFNQSALGDFG